MRYNKLVRDKIPDYIRKKGDTPITHIANEAEYWQKLKEKLLEEIEEFNKDENAEEYADILEVLEAIADYKEFDKEEVQRIKIKKAEERGKFKDRIILDES
ncbi:MAG: nucleoside triphosphate pyrophosphohydrolase [Minisyncoccia bacterium]